jgi:hypothetical protein
VYSRTMAKKATYSTLQHYALLGAQARLQQLAEETADIYRQFPQLRTRRPRHVDGTDSTSSSSPGRRRKRRCMSAANRQAVSERMRKYWAERRAQNSNGAEAAAADGTRSERQRPLALERVQRKRPRAAPERCRPPPGGESPMPRRRAGQQSARACPVSRISVARPVRASDRCRSSDRSGEGLAATSVLRASAPTPLRQNGSIIFPSSNYPGTARQLA